MKSLIIIFSLFAFGRAGCPSVCSCTKDAVLCIENDIECIPSFESLENEPAIIDLSGNDISVVDNDDFSFDASVSVIEIYLNSSNVVDINVEAFHEVINLQQLYLHDNLLSSIPEDVVEKNKNLVLLNLSNNRFVKMPKLASKSLEVLALANSKVSLVPHDSLEKLPQIKLLILRQNNIKQLSIDMFQSAKSFFFASLTNNPWECNCKTIDLFEYLANKKFIDHEEPVQCLSEEKLFVNIYQNGVIEKYKDKCGLNSDRETLFSGSLIRTEKEDIKGDLKQSNLIAVDEDVPLIENIVAVPKNETLNCHTTSPFPLEVYLVFILSSVIVLTSFILGYYLGKRNNMYMMGSTDSKFKLILP